MPKHHKKNIGSKTIQTKDVILMPKDESRRLITLFLFSKATVICLILIAFTMGHQDINLWNRWYTGNVHDAFYIPFVNWDAQHFLLLADRGYNTFDQSNGFFPLFPLLIRGLNIVVNNFIYSAFIIVLLASAALVYFMYRFACHYGDKHQAFTGTVLYLLWPASFFFSVVYSEALIVCLMLGFLYFYHIKKDYRSIPFAVLMPIAKSQSLFFVTAIIIHVIWRLCRRCDVNKTFEAMNFLAFACGGLIYLAFYKIVTGSCWSGLESQSLFVFGFSLKNVINPIHFVHYLFSAVGPLFDYKNSLMDRLFIIAMLVGLLPVIRTKDSLLICCYATMTYCLASVGDAGSGFTRFSLYPAPYLMVALQCQPRYVIWTIGLVFILIQILLVQQFAQGYWVG